MLWLYMCYFNFNNMKHSVKNLFAVYVHFKLLICVWFSFCRAINYWTFDSHSHIQTGIKYKLLSIQGKLYIMGPLKAVCYGSSKCYLKFSSQKKKNCFRTLHICVNLKCKAHYSTAKWIVAIKKQMKTAK